MFLCCPKQMMVVKVFAGKWRSGNLIDHFPTRDMPFLMVLVWI